MKLRILATVTVVAFATFLHAGSQTWEASASYSGVQQGFKSGSFWPTTTTQFTAQIIGSGSISGTASASSQNGTIVHIAGFFNGTVNEFDSGTAYAGDGVHIYNVLNAHYSPGSFGSAIVTASW